MQFFPVISFRLSDGLLIWKRPGGSSDVRLIRCHANLPDQRLAVIADAGFVRRRDDPTA